MYSVCEGQFSMVLGITGHVISMWLDVIVGCRATTKNLENNLRQIKLIKAANPPQCFIECIVY